MKIFILVLFCLLIYKLFKSHMKIHNLKRTVKIIWNDKRKTRDVWDKSICIKCIKGVEDYKDYEEYFMYEICCKCKKKKAATDTGVWPTCWDCYGYQYQPDGYEYLEQYGYSIVEMGV